MITFYKIIFASLVLVAPVLGQKVDVLVLDDLGDPVDEAEVSIVYLTYNIETDTRIIGKSDEDGKFHAEGETPLGIEVKVEKEGYYESRTDRLSRNMDHNLVMRLLRKKNPTALHVRKVSFGFPLNAEFVGFDLKKGELVKPYGKGEVADVMFMSATEHESYKSASGVLTIQFADYCGLQMVPFLFGGISDLKMDYEAPVGGYEQVFVRVEESIYNTNLKQQVGYYLRTRVVEEDGEILSANYTKIVGDFRFDPRHSGWHVDDENRPKEYGSISFTYYFNPTENDRNLEFEIGNNLFKDLDPIEKVFQP